jgi:hypothetical protein
MSADAVVGVASGGTTNEGTPMSQSHLHRTLKALHAELANKPALADHERAMLSTALVEIQRTLDANTPHEPEAVERLEHATVAFEVQHPTLAALAKELSTLLRGAGV